MEKFQRIVAYLVSVMVGVYTIFQISVFHSICIFSNKYSVLYHHVFLYILSILREGNWILSGQFIQFFSFGRTIYILGSFIMFA